MINSIVWSSRICFRTPPKLILEASVSIINLDLGQIILRQGIWFVWWYLYAETSMAEDSSLVFDIKVYKYF